MARAAGKRPGSLQESAGQAHELATRWPDGQGPGPPSAELAAIVLARVDAVSGLGAKLGH